MPYPLSMHGAVLSELSDVPATLTRIEDSLREAKARAITRDGDTICFRGSPMSRRFGGSVLTVISRGRIRVTHSDAAIRVEYDLGFLQNHLVRGLVSAAAFGAIFFGVKTADPLTTLAAGTLFWFLLVTLDYVLAVSLFPRYLASKIEKT